MNPPRANSSAEKFAKAVDGVASTLNLGLFGGDALQRLVNAALISGGLAGVDGPTLASKPQDEMPACCELGTGMRRPGVAGLGSRIRTPCLDLFAEFTFVRLKIGGEPLDKASLRRGIKTCCRFVLKRRQDAEIA
jgi:hypothetical protein